MLSLLIPKVVLGGGLLAVIALGVRAPAPRRLAARAELRSVVAGGLCLYLVGALAALAGHKVLSALVLASGICISSVAVWLSRGSDDGLSDPEDPGEPAPPPGPDPIGPVDWDRFERELEEFSRSREPVAV